MRDWNAKYKKLKRHEATPKEKKARKMHDGREPLNVQLDDQVFDFLQERQNFGLAVSNVAPIDEAKRVAAELNIVGFKASNGWLVRWKQRFNVGLQYKTNESQALPEHYQHDLLEFCRQIIQLRETHDRWLITCELIKLILPPINTSRCQVLSKVPPPSLPLMLANHGGGVLIESVR